jgi:hypothetical protein
VEEAGRAGAQSARCLLLSVQTGREKSGDEYEVRDANTELVFSLGRSHQTFGCICGSSTAWTAVGGLNPDRWYNKIRFTVGRI